MNEDAGLRALRARDWDEFVGQEKVSEGLKLAIRAAKERGEALEHVLLYGPPGLGKTTLAYLIGKSMGQKVRATTGPALERPADLASILNGLEEGEVLFIDEIHRLGKAVEELLYPAMEDFHLDMVLGKGPGARVMRLDLPHFTLVGATTRVGKLSAPLRDRFGVVQRLGFYKAEELAEILLMAAERLAVGLEKEAAIILGGRARRTPRVALKLLRRVRDLAQVKGVGVIDKGMVEEALGLMQIDNLGLEETDRRLLRALAVDHKGEAVGLETIAAMINEDRVTVEEMYEPFLLREGLIRRTNRGRVATEKSYRHLGLRPKPPHQ